MPRWDEATLTEQQRRWFAALREGLERDTGHDLQAWAEIARTCPEAGHRARLAWLKAHHGLGQNRASMVLAQAFPEAPPAATTADDPLWSDPAARAVCDAVAALATRYDGVTTGRRKSFTAFSRHRQFAALRPVRGGAARLGLAVPPDADPRLFPRPRESWSERLTATLDLQDAAAADEALAALLHTAWERS